MELQFFEAFTSFSCFIIFFPVMPIRRRKHVLSVLGCIERELTMYGDRCRFGIAIFLVIILKLYEGTPNR